MSGPSMTLPIEPTSIGLQSRFAPQAAGWTFVELYADQDTRLAREGTELRLKHKRSLQDREASRQRLLDADAAHQFSTGGDFFYPNQYLRVDNTHLTPAQAAERIAEHLRIAVGQGGRSVRWTWLEPYR